MRIRNSPRRWTMCIIFVFVLLQRGVGRSPCRCAVGRIAISQWIRWSLDLNPAVDDRSICNRWRGGGITATAEVVYMIWGWFAIAVLSPWCRSENGRSRLRRDLSTLLHDNLPPEWVSCHFLKLSEGQVKVEDLVCLGDPCIGMLCWGHLQSVCEKSFKPELLYHYFEICHSWPKQTHNVTLWHTVAWKYYHTKFNMISHK